MDASSTVIADALGAIGLTASFEHNNERACVPLERARAVSQVGGPGVEGIGRVLANISLKLHRFWHPGCRCVRCYPVTGRLHLKMVLMRPDGEIVLEQTMDALSNFRWDAVNPIVMPSSNGSGRTYLYGYRIESDVSYIER